MGNCYLSGTALAETEKPEARSRGPRPEPRAQPLPAETPDPPVPRKPALAALPSKVSQHSAKLADSRSTSGCSERKEVALARRDKLFPARAAQASLEADELLRQAVPLLGDPGTCSSISRRRASNK